MKTQLQVLASLVTVLVAQNIWAGPMCDRLALIRSDLQTCDSRNREIERDTQSICNETQRMLSDMASGRIDRDLRICQDQVVREQASIPDLNQRLRDAQDASAQVAQQLQSAQRDLRVLTRAYECVGMDKKWGRTYRASGATEQEARDLVERPVATGLSSADAAVLADYISMANKHGKYVFCLRNYADRDPGAGPLAYAN